LATTIDVNSFSFDTFNSLNVIRTMTVLVELGNFPLDEPHITPVPAIPFPQTSHLLIWCLTPNAKWPREISEPGYKFSPRTFYGFTSASPSIYPGTLIRSK
jgi:hypothetical protein